MLRGKVALVTGASSGIGWSIARRFLEEGGIVGVHYCRNRQGVEQLVSIARSGQCHAFQADFAESQQVLRLWNGFLKWAGTIDILVNNAGEVVMPVPFEEISEEVCDRTFQVNVKAPLLLSQNAFKIMRQKSYGRIINISSIGVKFGGGPTTLHYSASKAALEAMTRSIAKVGAPYNVLVNAIRAGVTDTPFHRKMGRDDLPERVKLIPLGRAAHPDEIAEMVLFLASKKSSYITGSIISVSGGE